MNVAKVYEAGRVLRFHTLADYGSGERQSVGEHSWGVALLAMELAYRRQLDDPGRVLRAALLHDVEESVTGDLPASTKWRFPGLAGEMVVAELQVRKAMGVVPSLLSQEETDLLKWADSLELYAYCVRKVRAGNETYGVVRDNIERFMRTELPQWVDATALREELA